MQVFSHYILHRITLLCIDFHYCTSFSMQLSAKTVVHRNFFLVATLIRNSRVQDKVIPELLYLIAAFLLLPLASKNAKLHSLLSFFVKKKHIEQLWTSSKQYWQWPHWFQIPGYKTNWYLNSSFPHCCISSKLHMAQKKCNLGVCNVLVLEAVVEMHLC